MIIRTTGSQLDRVVRCTASAALPQIVDASPRDDRDAGTAIHAFLERVGAIGREAALAEVDPQWRDRCADLELGKLAAQLAMTHELAIAYNWRTDTARILQPVERRVYEIDDDCELAATIDVAGVNDVAVYAGDYKGSHGWLPDAASSFQLGLGALALSRVFGRDRAEVEYIRFRDDGTPRKFRGSLDAFALLQIADNIRGTMITVDELRLVVVTEGLVPNVVEGPWCRYCPAKHHCPAKTALVRQVLADPHPIPYSQPLTPETALRVYQLLQPAKDAIKQAEAAIYAYAKLTPIPLGVNDAGDERFFGELARPGNEELDGAVAFQVLTEKYDGATAAAAVTMETSKRAIADVVRPKLAAGEKISHVTEAIYDDIRARGGATRPETRSVIEYTVDPEGSTKARRRKAG